MAELHKALECLRPKDFSDVPTDNLKSFLPGILANAELIANSVPPPPNGTPYESAQRTRTSPQPAANAADLTKSEVRRPPPAKDHEALQKSWGKPVKLSAQQTATGMSVYKMAGHDRHGAWFARSSVHEGLGFSKWKRMMQREFPESLEVQGGPGEGNIRGIGGDQRLEDLTVDGVGNLQVYQLSAQFPGPTSPREFITLLITSENALSEASKIDSTVPRHWMVVSIPVTHPEAPPRAGMVLGQYESIEMIREIPLTGNDDAETNPVEWIMVTRSDPGGGIPRFMVERNVPSSIVADAIKFLDWACARNDNEPSEASEAGQENTTDAPQQSVEAQPRYSLENSNGLGAGVGTSIADRPSSTRRRASHQVVGDIEPAQDGYLDQLRGAVGGLSAYIPDAMNPMPQLQRTISSSSSSTASSADSFASATQFTSAPQGLPIDNTIPTPSTASEVSVPVNDDSHHARELNSIETKKLQLREKFDSEREKRSAAVATASQQSQKDIEKAAEKHARDKKKQEEKYAKEMRKLEERREKETKKLLARQQKEADKSKLATAQRERDEARKQKELVDKENKLLKEQVAELQRENTALVVKLGKSDIGKDILASFRAEGGRTRASSRASGSSVKSGLVRSGTAPIS
ncbi:uncharacterized protein M421DRAFT_69691 [Didymella exigua CBS 183.55]|uniref:DUF3074 domain-containing protein n=1 Tax=Didymella exigua CBS 183.55 TaxID=1150837 RepID=A0A6A5RB93_9PLEO|nr:uncharacterized protein M421DRAFT_69691 [Didymella exigua CBS 183.55]KAF1925505.1 hypothetical protein M421DRAFT_69691 [Didymella exigua CBS 183.55]